MIKDGADTFLQKEYTYLSIFCALFAVVLVCTVDMPWVPKESGESLWFPYTTFAFLVGAATSMASGLIGMKIATRCNFKTTAACAEDKIAGFKIAFMGGQVLGFMLVGLALLVLEIIILAYKPSIMNADNIAAQKIQVRTLFEYISGYGLGGSTVALFGRVGGGIYTKAADVGADLAGKVAQGLPEDSPKNPGTIADNVGDNVGDIAGMGADLFGSLAESTCAALVVSSTCDAILLHEDAAYFPLVITGIGICVSFVTIWFAHMDFFGEAYTVDKRLFWQVVVSTLLMTVAIIPAVYMLPEEMVFTFGGRLYEASPWKIFGCIAMGLWSGMVIGGSTEYYTSNAYAPTQQIAESTRFGPAPVIIKGLALGYLSNIIPIFCLAATILVSFSFAAMYGVAMAAIGMLGVLPIALTIDGYGPIADNAGGIAEMAMLAPEVRERTDELDAAGNTTAAIGKGFAIGSAALVALALFGAFITRVGAEQKETINIDILNPLTFAGLLFGAMLPYWFSALTMDAVGTAAEEMITEIVRQEPLILAGGKPDHERCIAISTNASLARMIAPGCIVILSPLIIGMLFGFEALAGLLAGIIVSGIQIAFSASNTGGSWDNCKKFVEAGKLITDGKKVEKKETVIELQPDGTQKTINRSTMQHAAAVVGDTVGDPLKDTSGPSINILVKLSAITSLVFGSFIAQYGGKVFNITAPLAPVAPA